MSAFILSNAHITLIAAAYGFYAKKCVGNFNFSSERAQEIGNALFSQNAAAVAHRYNEEAAVCDWRFPSYAYSSTAPQPAGSRLWATIRDIWAMFKAIDCYEYQAEQSPEWENSEAKRICGELRHFMALSTTAYNEAPWEYENDGDEHASTMTDAPQKADAA